MNFNNHSDLEGMHAFLSCSQYHWVNYSDEKLVEKWKTYFATEKGTALHDLAKNMILLGVKPKGRGTFSLYVNDAIGFKMTPEQVLYYSSNCFGTADAIAFDEKKGFLRIHDLKTGVTPAKMIQLYLYASLFCLEYNVRPADIEIETRLYQNDEVLIDNPNVEVIAPLMDKIVTFDKMLEQLKLEE